MLNKYSSGYNRLILTQSVNQNLIYEKEQFEILKNFLNEYMFYFLIHKLPIVEEKVNNIDINIEQITLFQEKIQLAKEKINQLKIKFLNVIALTYLKKQKLKNTKKVLSYLKTINKWKEMYFISITPIQTKELSLEEIIHLITEITMSKYEKKTTILKLLIESIDNQKHKHKNQFEEEFSKMFLETYSETQINSLYDKYLVLNSQDNNVIYSFINNIFSVLDRTLLKKIKSSILCCGIVSAEQDNINSNLINSFQIFRNFRFENEEKIFLCFKQICLNVIDLLSIYNKYLGYQKIPYLANLLLTNKIACITIITNKLYEIIDIFARTISTCSTRKYTYLIISCLCILNKTLIIFCGNNKVNDFLFNKVNNLLKFNVFEELKIMIFKTKSLLSNDNWTCISNFEYNDIIKNHLSCIQNYSFYINFLYENAELSTQKKDEITFDNLYRLLTLIDSQQNNDIKCYNTQLNKQIILNKEILSSKLIFSSSVITVISYICDFIKYIKIIPNFINEIYSYIFALFDYFIIGGLYMFIPPSQIQLIANKTISINGVCSLEKIEKVQIEILYIQKYLNLRLFIKETYIKILERVFNKELTLSQILPQLSSTIITNNKGKLEVCIPEKIIFYESILSLYKFIKHTIPQNLNDCNNRIIQYKKVLNEIKEFIYLPTCYKLFNFQLISYSIINNANWDIQTEVTDNKLNNEKSEFIINIIHEINNISKKLDELSLNIITSCAKKRYLKIGLIFLKNELFEVICKARKWSSIGRTKLYNDILYVQKYFKEELTINAEEIFSELLVYTKAWFYNENELFEYVRHNAIKLNYINVLIDQGSNFEQIDLVKKTFLKKTVLDIMIQKIILFLERFK